MASNPPPAPQRLRKGTLAALVGLGTAGLLFNAVPAEESGRKVTVDFGVDGAAHLTHISGPQYLKAYRDIAGIPTDCDGLTKGVQMGDVSTPEQCTARLEAALIEHAAGVMRCSPGLALDKPHRDNVRFAAISMAYNIGVGAWCGSSARKLVDAGQIRAACDAFLAWDKARVNGVLRPVKGLTARRQRERAACLKDA
ncbi:MAG: lysozyme [Caulobacteraceae bacterium]|nr:lysozyme [Caulobacteraceae bacterium]